MAKVSLVDRHQIMKNTVTVVIGDKSVEIKKLPLGKYAELLRAIKELPKSIGLIDGVSNDKIFEKLPDLLANSLPDIINILTIATPLTREEIESDEFGLDEAVQVVAGIIEVNNYSAVFNNIKKMTASRSLPVAKTLTTG